MAQKCTGYTHASQLFSYFFFFFHSILPFCIRFLGAGFLTHTLLGCVSRNSGVSCDVIKNLVVFYNTYYSMYALVLTILRMIACNHMYSLVTGVSSVAMTTSTSVELHHVPQYIHDVVVTCS